MQDFDFFEDDLRALREDELDDIVGGVNPWVKCLGVTHNAIGCV